MSRTTVDINAVIHNEDGTYWAEVPEIPGVFATGHTLDELVEALTEAYALFVKEGRGVVTIGPTHSERPGVAEIKLRVPTPPA
jgi:predicted RNase H-like HicB family nuclease